MAIIKRIELDKKKSKKQSNEWLDRIIYREEIKKKEEEDKIRIEKEKEKERKRNMTKEQRHKENLRRKEEKEREDKSFEKWLDKLENQKSNK